MSYLKNPVGTLLSYHGTQPPSWLMRCEGQTLRRQDYPELYEVLKYSYGGTGDEFRLPDYRETIYRETAIKVLPT